MKVIAQQQARTTLVLISCSAILQLMALPWSFTLLSGVLMVVAWAHWWFYWPVPTGVRLLGLLSFMGLIIGQFGGVLGLEPMVALFVGSLLLKVLEVRSQRDVYLVVLLSLFGLATPLLFSPELWWFLVVLVVAILHVSLLAMLHGQSHPAQALYGTLGLLLRSVPLALLLFLLVPRLPPLWAVPMASHQSVTGLSEFLSLGSMDNLSRDGSLAFSARFSDQHSVPAQAERYWRSLMLVDYDGDQWMAADVKHLNVDQTAQLTAGWQYQILLSPSAQHWLPVLGSALAWPDTATYLSDGTLRAKQPINARQLFEIRSHQAIVTPPMNAAWQNRLTALPPGLHPRTRALARDYRRHFPDESVLEAILQGFAQENFSYTLQPSPLVGDKVDHFMFATRQGFCEHYAVAFAVMARELGYPARIATGYLGGERSQVDPATLMVYQYDAHAWVEVWLADKGWVRFDPTAWISPDRVDTRFMDRAVWRDADLPLLEELTWLFRGQWGLNQLRHGLEWINLQWMQFMASFDGAGQMQFLNHWLGRMTSSKLLLLMALVALPGMIWMFLDVLRVRRRGLAAQYRTLLARFSMPQNTSPADLADELSKHFPAHQSVIKEYCRVLESYWFGRFSRDEVKAKKALNALEKMKGRESR